MFKTGQRIYQQSPDVAQEYFMILSEIPNLQPLYVDLAIEACLLVQGIKREEYESLDQLIDALNI